MLLAARRSFSLLLLFSSSVFSATIEECIGRCSIWLWGPSQVDATHTERQASQLGVWNGHSGEFLYWDFKRDMTPFVWHALVDPPPPGPLGPPVEMVMTQFITVQEEIGGVIFSWTDTDGSFHWDVVTAPTVVEQTALHAKYLWQCQEGLDPPYPSEPWPEPGTFWIAATSLAALGAHRFRRGSP